MANPETTKPPLTSGFANAHEAAVYLRAHAGTLREARAENARLRAALAMIAATAGPHRSHGTSGDGHARCITLAQAALKNDHADGDAVPEYLFTGTVRLKGVTAQAAPHDEHSCWHGARAGAAGRRMMSPEVIFPTA